MLRAAALAALLFAAGCGGAEGPAETADAGGLPGPDGSTGQQTQDLYQSGSRLKARMLVTADGAKSFNGWRDTKRGENCFFADATDGKTRCLPDCLAASVEEMYYPTDSCTGAPLAVAGHVSTPPRCIRTRNALGRSPVFYTWTTPTPGSIYVKTGPQGPCVLAVASQLQYSSFFMLGVMADPLDFVEGVEQLE